MRRPRPVLQTSALSRAWLGIALWGGLALAYLILAVIFTRPLAFHAVDFTARGSGSGDQCQFIWSFWWTKTALFNLHQSPFWTDVIYYPHGTGLGYHNCLFTNLLAILVSAVSGTPINAPLLYNMLVLISFVVIGLGSFALIRHVVRDTLAAFIGSLIVTFSPYFFFHLDHLNLLMIGWGIFSIYFTIRYLETLRVTDLAWAVIFFTAQLYASLTNAMLVSSFLFFYLLFSSKELLSRAGRGRLVLGGISGGFLATILAMPLLLSLRSCGSDWPLTWHDSVRFSADLLDFVIPENGSGLPGPGEVYVGWLIIFLAVAVLLYTHRKSRLKWAALAATFLALSLGPTLLIAGRQTLDGWLPYRWLYSLVPYFSLNRTPARFIVLAEFCLAVLAAFGLKAVFDRLRRSKNPLVSRWLPATVSAVLMLAIFADYHDGAIVLEPMYVPPVYEQVAADTTIHVICDLPIKEKLQICNWYMYWQTIHGRKAANGYLAHHSKTATVLLDQIKSWDELGPPQKAELAAAGIDAVVLHHPDRESELIRLK